MQTSGDAGRGVPTHGTVLQRQGSDVGDSASAVRSIVVQRAASHGRVSIAVNPAAGAGRSMVMMHLAFDHGDFVLVRDRAALQDGGIFFQLALRDRARAEGVDAAARPGSLILKQSAIDHRKRARDIVDRAAESAVSGHGVFRSRVLLERGAADLERSKRVQNRAAQSADIQAQGATREAHRTAIVLDRRAGSLIAGVALEGAIR